MALLLAASIAGPHVSRGHDDQARPAGDMVAAVGTRLSLDGQAYRFRGLNLYNINGDGDCGYPIDNLGTELEAIGDSANVVRGWFFQYLATDHATGARDWSVMDATLEALRRRDLRVVATLADEWGACEARASRGPLQIEWYSDGYRTTPYNADVTASYRDWVMEIVTRYRDDPTVLAWQLMNEATAVSDRDGRCPDQDAAAAALQAWAADMAQLVKAIDSHHLLSIGTSGASQCGTAGARFAALHAIEGVDLCEIHDYAMPSGGLMAGVGSEIAACRQVGKPVFVGEVGIAGLHVGGDLHRRAALLRSRMEGHLRAGSVGELLWAWRSEGDGGSSETSFDIGPGDPALEVLAGLAGYRLAVSRAARLQ